jgi:tetratricopeptide (TPR) repeat protein
MPIRPLSPRWLLALALLTLCTVALAQSADAMLDRASALLDRGAAPDAYALLAPLLSQRAGDPEYDFLLGLSALETGRHTEAVLALERVLAVDPENSAARTQLARAYVRLQETEGARRELEAVRAQDIPAELSETIGRYLSAIEQTGAGEGPSATFFLEFAGGYDSNVNGGPDALQYAVPAIPGSIFRLEPTARETPDSFFSTSAGMAARNPLGQRAALIGGLSASTRLNFTEADFNTVYLDGYLGLSATRERNTFTLIGQGNVFLANDPALGQAYRNALGGMLQWTHERDARNQFTAYVQYASLTYPEQAPRDANRTIAGLAFAHALGARSASLYAGVYGGAEAVTDAAFEYLSYRPIGVLAGGQVGLSDRTYAFATLALEHRGYRDADPFFEETRADTQCSLAAGLHYLLRDRWRVSPQVSWLANDSNIVVNDYDRWQAYVSLRRDW